MPEPVFFQAHRGSIDEAPENTLAAYRYAWQFSGAIPEVDIRTSRDGVMICLHNPTLAATTAAPPPLNRTPVSELNLADIRRWDAGKWFDPDFKDEPVPTFAEVLDLMVEAPDRRLYPDLKDVDLAALQTVIDHYNVEDRLIFTHGQPDYLRDLIKTFPAGRTMTWCSGPPARIKDRFETLAASNFAGINYLQFHWPSERHGTEISYLLDTDFLLEARQRLADAGVEVQLRLFDFDIPALRRLLDLGVRWFVTDAPGRFSACLAQAWQVGD